MSSQNSVKNRSIEKRIRMRRADSAFVYFILEAHEGICSYSTLPFEKGATHLDMVLRITPDFVDEVGEVLKKLGDKVYELDSE
jgi:hypothetical protein